MRKIAKRSIFANELNNEVWHHREQLYDHESNWLTAIWCYSSQFWDSRLTILNDVSIEYVCSRFWMSSSFQNARSYQYNISRNVDNIAQCTSQLDTQYNLHAIDCIYLTIDLTSREILDGRHIHHHFSIRKKFFSCLFREKLLFAVDQNIVIYMSNAQQMIELWKNQITSIHKRFFHVDDKDDEIENFQLFIKKFQLIKCSRIIIEFFSDHKAERHIKLAM
jgi:hypothetical protein